MALLFDSPGDVSTYVTHHCILALQFKHPTDMKPTSALLKIEFQRKTLQLESTCLLG